MKHVQTLLTENCGTSDKCTDALLEDYGDKLDKKEEDHIRIAFQNINGIKGKINALHKVLTTIEERT